jgi:hypothetical protein
VYEVRTKLVMLRPHASFGAYAVAASAFLARRRWAWPEAQCRQLAQRLYHRHLGDELFDRRSLLVTRTLVIERLGDDLGAERVAPVCLPFQVG